MRAALVALALVLLSTRQAQTPVEWSHLDDPAARWICTFTADWKAIMRRDYPGHDRSIPSVERRCHMPRETLG